MQNTTENDTQADIVRFSEIHAGLPALLAHLKEDDAIEERWDTYGLTTVDIGGTSYAIGTDEECDSAAREYIEQGAWAFNASFILSECGLPLELEEVISAFQSKECEGANDAICALIEKTCGMGEFCKSAISADGRGHLLSSYDGEEIELSGGFFAFRVS